MLVSAGFEPAACNIREAGLVVGVTGIIRRALRRGWRRRRAKVTSLTFAAVAVTDRVASGWERVVRAPRQTLFVS